MADGTDDRSLPAIGDRLDQYQITRLIARSATALILEATDCTNGSTVTLKVPHSEYAGDPVFQANFRREQQIGRRLDHPNLLRVLEPSSRTWEYMVMESGGGVPLRALLTPGAPWQADRALLLLRELAETLVYLHGQGIVHRDLKPENVLVLPSGGIKVVDFGLALDRPHRHFAWLGSTTSGTPDYMSPEQARGLAGDERSDVYALGIMMYELFTGALPFPAGGGGMRDPFDVMQAKRASDPVPPSHFRPDLDPHLEEIIVRAIERAPRRRYASALDLLRDLRAPDAVEVSRRAARLRPRTLREIRIRQVVMVGGAALAVIGALALLVWLANRYPVATGH